MLHFNCGIKENQGFVICEDTFDAEKVSAYEAVFCQGNGYLGQRASLEEGYPNEQRNLFVSGVFDRFHPSEVSELVNLPDFSNLTLSVNGETFGMCQGELVSFERRLNLRTGEHTRRCVWRSPKGTLVSLQFRRFASLAREHVLAFRVEITAMEQSCALLVTSGINGTVTNSGTQHLVGLDKRLLDERIMMMQGITLQSEVTCTQYAAHRFQTGGSCVPLKRRYIMPRRRFMEITETDLAAGQTVAVEKICLVHTTRDLKPIDGLAEIRRAVSTGYEALLSESVEAWYALWQATDIRVDSESDYDQAAIRFALYHVNIMCNKTDPRVGIGAKGLTGEGYKGHSFWDTEIFLLPYFIFTQPDVARVLLTYRHRTLPGAMEKAKSNGYRGALYPWESAWETDGETTPLYGDVDSMTGEPSPILTGLIEHHISADITYAIWQYYTVTGDEDFMARYGREIILKTAQFWASRAQWSEVRQAYEILDVIGPDEYKEHVDNNAYTNYMAHFNMKLAQRFVSDPDIDRVADRLYLPAANPAGILPQDDTYLGLKDVDVAKYKKALSVGTIAHDYNMAAINAMQVSKQADVVLLMLLLENLFDEDAKQKNFDYYEARTLHDSSLSKATHCVLAQDLKRYSMAYDFFRSTCQIDLPNGGVPTSSDGVHSASLGGVWQCVVYGFGGVRIHEEQLHIAPCLPGAWKSLAFRLVWRGQPLAVRIGEKTEIINHGDRPVTVFVNGEEMPLSPARG